MLTLTNGPPEDPRGNGLPLLRTPTGRPLVAIVTSVDLVGTPTHFWKGRTVPCEIDECEPCENGMPWRWHGYLAAYRQADALHFLFEFTARASQAFLEYRKAYGSLRGCAFRAHRVNLAANARVHLVCKPADLAGIALPQPPDLVRVLSVLWNIATPDLEVADLMKGLPRVRVDSSGRGEALPPDGNGNGNPHAPQPVNTEIPGSQRSR